MRKHPEHPPGAGFHPEQAAGLPGTLLYEETYQDRENDVMISEHCIKGYGAYPG